MIVRTYGRRNRGKGGGGDDDDDFSDGFDEPILSQENPQDVYSFAFSSQDSSHWSLNSEPYASNSSQEARELSIIPPRRHGGGYGEGEEGCFRKSKKARVNGNHKGFDLLPKRVKSGAVAGTATLMETQECGEMMEHVDEVNFALDGLRKGGQQIRVRRASLLSLLSICGTAPRRRLLRTHGMARTIIDAVLGLPFDDSPSNLAAAALFYILTSDGQDEHLLDSPSCIRFLIKLLKPLTHGVSKDKASTISSKLIALRKNVDILQDTSKGTDSTSAAIMLKVQEVLVSCKEMKSSDGKDNAMTTPKLTPKWIALLTMEKACLSTISLEDTSGTVRKTGGNFKEKLRELGGLDAVFDVARSCHVVMERCLEKSSFSSQELEENAVLESLVLLLKCLKIMENATFLSKDNQCHLLEMKGSFNHQGSPRSFTKLIISVIKILSGLSLSRNSCGNSDDDNFCNISNGTHNHSEMLLLTDRKEGGDEIISISSSLRCSSIDGTSSQKSFRLSQNSRWLSTGRSEVSKPTSETMTSSEAGTFLLKMRVDSSTSSSSSGAPVKGNDSKLKFSLGKKCKVAEDTNFKLLEDSVDPFAFQEDEFEPSKWDLLSGVGSVGKLSEAQNRKAAYREKEIGCQSQLILSQQESSNGENPYSGASCSSALVEEKSNLLAECLLTAVKVLMNLTNDNPMGCRQIAACGGLETLSSLIAGHFPSFSSSLSPFRDISDNTLSNSNLTIEHQNESHLSDQELDFLVAILGLLVNLVEKDGENRSMLAAAIVSLPGVQGLEEERHSNVIPLLCSIFLANQGAGEAAEEGRALALDDEEALLQGEKEAEKMIVEAYAALLLAFLSTESMSIRGAIAECLPDHKLAILVPVLERFVEFHLTLNMISPETHTTVLEVIESCRVP
ncbi:wings apart-like protein 2 [Rhododendron vialii]|uniref:wings apart-like protein 2 n=1 Tax=Rhododendron vialii TaxID=182163 RepID=UPI00265E3176|nr:wings apart-like protein 2 [Rhododendron vialii]